MPEHVIVLGGGLAGQHAAETFNKKKVGAKVTVVTANKFAEWPIAMPYVLSRPQFHYKALSEDSSKYEIKGVDYKYDVVTGVDTAKKEVKLTNETLAYDVLIVATGFDMPLIYPALGTTLQERKDEVQKAGSAIRSAGSVVIGGGGPVALDLVGNIRAAFPDKKLTLVCAGLLPQWPADYQAKVEAQCKAMKIDVVKTQDRCPAEALFDAGSLSGVAYDVYIPCFSQGPNTKFLQGTSLLDGKGCIKVNQYLQACDCKEVFAVGVSDAPAAFIAIPKLEVQWNCVALNAAALIQGKSLTPYKEGVPFMKRPPLVLLGHGKGAYAFLDFENVPPPVKCCCCCGKGGFPCCPPPCCWPCCGPCCIGYCCGTPDGEGMAKLYEVAMFKFSTMHFKGFGEGPQSAPEQKSMK